MTDIMNDPMLKLALRYVGETTGHPNLWNRVKMAYDTLSTSHHNGYEHGYSVGYQQAAEANKAWMEGWELYKQEEAKRTAIDDNDLYKAAAALDNSNKVRVNAQVEGVTFGEEIYEEDECPFYEGDSGDEDNMLCGGCGKSSCELDE